MKLIFATNNAHKVTEIKSALNNKFDVKSLADIDCFDDIPETEDTLEGNAKIKSTYVSNKFRTNCFGDDTGLEIEALNGEPGVYSARYAGENCSFEDNINKVLLNMKGAVNRKARFRTVISLILNNQEYQFEGVVDGEILTERVGDDGFGYDPIFKPNGYDITFAEMSIEDKNEISHRGLAVKKLIEFLNNYNS